MQFEALRDTWFVSDLGHTNANNRLERATVLEVSGLAHRPPDRLSERIEQVL
jgi:hypothetical protein